MNIVIYLSVILSLTYYVAAELKFVFVMVKGPDHQACNYPDGPKIASIDESQSHLTKDGINEAFDLGKLLSRVYKDQLKIDKWNSSVNYWPVATSSLRTQYATLIVGAGLEDNAKGKDESYWKDQLDSTYFAAMPGFLKFLNLKECPGYYRRLSTHFGTIRDLSKKYHNIIAEIKNKYPSVDISRPEHIWLAYETFKRMKQQKKGGLDWLNEEKMKQLKEYSAKFVHVALTSSNQIRQLAGGLLLNDLFHDMDELTHNKAQPHAPGGINNKFNIFVVPQALIAAQLAVFTPEGSTFGSQAITPENFYPEDGSYVIIELHNENNQWKVQLRYNNKPNPSGTGWQTIKFKGCGGADKCSYENFKKLLDNYLTSEAKHDALCK